MEIAVRVFAITWSIVAATAVCARPVFPPLVTPTFRGAKFRRQLLPPGGQRHRSDQTGIAGRFPSP
jgi:hypothetical protein